jgi:hypothetical protein
MNSRIVLVFPLIAALTACQSILAPEPPTQATPIAIPAAQIPAPVIIAPPPTPPAPVVTAQPPATEDTLVVISVLTDVSKALSGGGDSLRREMASSNAAWAKARTDSTRLKLAVLAAITSGGASDDQRALSLLEPYLSRTADANAYKALAELIAIPLQEKAKQMREEIKKTETQRERADNLKKELDATQQKLEALRKLERSLGRRQPQ